MEKIEKIKKIKIVFNAYQGTSKVYKDGKIMKEIHFKRPFLENIEAMLDEICDDVCEEFELTFSGTSFENAFLTDLIKKDDFEIIVDCRNESFSVSTDITERWESVKALLDKYGQVVGETARLKVYSDKDFDNSHIERVENGREADICVLSKNLVNTVAKDLKSKLILSFDKENSKKLDNDFRVWYVDESKLNEYIDMLFEEFVLIPRLKNGYETLKNSNALTVEEKKTVDLAVTVDYLIEIEKIERLEKGTTCEIQQIVTPKSGKPIAIRTEVENPRIIEVNGNSLKGIGFGDTQVRFYSEESDELISNQTITVFIDRNVKEIKLNVDKTKFGKGDEIPFSIECKPEDAQDINDLIIYAEDSSVLEVDTGNNIIKAIGAGTTSLIAKTKNVKTSLEITVCHSLGEITLSEENIILLEGQDKRVYFNFENEDKEVYHCSYSLVTSSTNISVKFEDTPRKCLYIKALKEGEAHVILSTSDGLNKKELKVNVIKSKSDGVGDFFDSYICILVATFIAFGIWNGFGLLLAFISTLYGFNNLHNDNIKFIKAKLGISVLMLLYALAKTMLWFFKML